MLQRNKRDVTKANGNYSRQRSSKKGVERVARPIKEGLDFFSTNVTYFNDMKIKRLIRNKGSRAVGVLLNIYTKVFETSYYAEFNDDLSFIISDELREDEAFVNSVVIELAELSVIDKDVLLQYGIITSDVIQDMYFTAIVRRKEATLISELMLRNPAQYFDSNKESDPKIEMISIETANSSRKINVDNNLVHVRNVLTQNSSNKINVNAKETVNSFGALSVDSKEFINVNSNSINVDDSTQRERDIERDTEKEIDSDRDRENIVASDETTARIQYFENLFKIHPDFGILASNTKEKLLEYDAKLSVEVVNRVLEITMEKCNRIGYTFNTLKNLVESEFGPIKSIDDLEAHIQMYHAAEAEKAKNPIRVAPLNEQHVSQGLPF